MSAVHGVNTFSRFDVGGGQTVDIHVPQGGVGTVNIVNGPRSQIDGLLRSVQGGQTGGALYIANTNGIVVGPSGMIRAGTVGLSSTTEAFAKGVIGPDGAPSEAHVGQMIDGSAPRSEAELAVSGREVGQDLVRLTTGGRLIVSGEIVAGSRDAVMAAAVNTGRVEIDATQGVTIAGTGRIDGRWRYS